MTTEEDYTYCNRINSISSSPSKQIKGCMSTLLETNAISFAFPRSIHLQVADLGMWWLTDILQLMMVK